MVRRLFDSVHDMMVHPNGSQWTVLGYIMAEDERLECNDSFAVSYTHLTLPTKLEV